MSSLPGEIGDGNGGTLDAQKASQRDLLVALHVKVDRLVDDVKDHDVRLRVVETRIEVASGAELAVDKTKTRIMQGIVLLAAAIIGSLVLLVGQGVH
jgi:hypothetical protein